MRYTYRGDRFTDPALKGMRCDPVRWNRSGIQLGSNLDSRCVRGANGNMLVVDQNGRRWVVVGRQLRVNAQ